MSLRPRSPSRPSPDPEDDARVQAVLAVLGGRSPEQTAREWGVDRTLLGRWVRDFVAAGTAQVTNQPGPGRAAQRDRFLATVAHELRSPLAVAQGWTSMLLDGDLDASSTVNSARRLHEALRTLHERTRDLELLAAASLGRLQLDRRRLRAGDVVEGLPGVERDDVGGEGPDLSMTADPALFARILRDLWDAAHLPPEPTRVQVHSRHDGRWTELRVCRVGAPLDAAVLQALFEPFDLNDDGTGVTIGLYLARALTVAHGGTIGADQDGAETVFWVRVPAAAPEDVSACADERVRDGVQARLR